MKTYLTKIRSFVAEIASTLLRDWRGISMSRWAYGLIFVYTLIFAAPIFLMNDVGISFLSSVGVDHTSMLVSLITILEPTTFYNQMSAYHSSFYGWTYFCISFWLLLPIKLIAWGLGVPAFQPLYIGLKILHFIYGLLAALSFYFLSRRFVGEICAVAAALTLAFGTALFQFEYMFHPETIGVLFLNLGLIYLYDFCSADFTQKDERKKQYFIVLLFLVLSTLAKPSFFLIGAPLYLVLVAAYIHKGSVSFIPFFRKGEGVRLISSSFVFSIVVFFVINPSFFLKFSKAFQHQLDNANFQTHSPMAISTGMAAAKTWLTMLEDHPFTLFALGVTVAIALYFALARRRGPFARKAVVFLELCVLVNFVFTIFMYRMFVLSEYLIPIFPILVLNAFAFLHSGLRSIKVPAGLTSIGVIAVVAVLIFSEVKGNLANMISFYDYHSSQQYKVYNYIKNSLPNDISIAHDQLVAIPEGKNIKDYHFWQHPPEEIEAAKPNYIIYDTLNKFNGNYCEQTLTLMHMTETEPYQKIATLEKDGSDIEIWKRQ